MSKPYEIVVLGNNLGGSATAHYLLKHTLPALETMGAKQAYHITMVGPSKKMWYRICAPRVLAAPELINIDQIAWDTDKLFAEYRKDQFAWIQGLATGLDEDAKEVTVTKTDNSTEKVRYDSLIVSTGFSYDPLWGADDDFSATQTSFDAMHKALPNAKTVLIAGGGPVGVETAGELLSKYPEMKVTLVSGADRVLTALTTATSGRAEKMLKSMGATVIHNKRVTTPSRSSATSTTVTFDDNTSQTVDVYIHAVGGKPNTGFLPKAWLDGRGKVKVDADTLHGPVSDVYAFGDVASCLQPTLMDLEAAAKPLMSTIGQDLAAKITSNPKHTGALRARKFKPMKDTSVVPIGRNGGVSQLFGWGLPSFMCWFFKSRDFLLWKAKPTMDGSSYAKA